MSSLFVLFHGFSYGKWQGIEHAIGTVALESIAIAHNKVGSGEAFSDYKKREAPTIYYIQEYELLEKCYIPVENCFYGKDCNGKAVPVKITQMIDDKGEVFLPMEQNGTECLWFPTVGVYQVYAEAIDEENRYGFVMIKLFVNKGVDI